MLVERRAWHRHACVAVDDVESHQLVLDSMPVLLEMFTSPKTSTQTTLQLLQTLSLVCHRNRVAQVIAQFACLELVLAILTRTLTELNSDPKMCCFRKHGQKIGSVSRSFFSLTVVLNYAN